ncbi:MAG: CdaR family protein [Tepidiformaceae bacterium]
MTIHSNGSGHPSRWRITWLLLRSGISNFFGHWALAGFSLVAAFSIWFVIQDVENPRIQALVPPDPEPPSIQVTALNGGDYIVDALKPVQIKVEGRKGDITGLRPEDFKAQVDVKGVLPGESRDLPVQITRKPDGIRIVDIKPLSVTVTVHQAEVKQFPVTVRRIAVLPPGYQETDTPTLTPVSVEIRGVPDLVDSISSIDIDANLAGVRGDTSIEGELVAHTAGGNAVDVTITPARARADFKVDQTFVSRTLGFASPIAPGSTPAPGYRVASVTYDPPVVTVTGSAAVIGGLQSLSLEQVSVGGAKDRIQVTRQIDKITDVTIDRQTVIVTIDIKPIDCDQAAGPCASAVFVIAPDIKAPPGFALDPSPNAGGYSVSVRVTGPTTQLGTLKPGDIKATVSFTAPAAGTKSYDVKVTTPTGVVADPVDQLSVALRQAGSP